MKEQRRRMVIFLAGGLALIALVRFGIVPAMEYTSSARARLSRVAAQSREVAVEAERYSKRREAIELYAEGLKNKRKGFFLPTQVAEITKKAGLDKKISGLRSGKSRQVGGLKEESVSLSLKGVTLAELQGVLYDLELGDGTLRVTSLSLKQAKEGLDVVADIQAFSPAD